MDIVLLSMKRKLFDFVDLFRCMRLGKNDSVTHFFFSEAIACFLSPSKHFIFV